MQSNVLRVKHASAHGSCWLSSIIVGAFNVHASAYPVPMAPSPFHPLLHVMPPSLARWLPIGKQLPVISNKLFAARVVPFLLAGARHQCFGHQLMHHLHIAYNC